MFVHIRENAKLFVMTIVTGISQKLSNVFYFSVSLIGISAGRSTFTTVATARRNPVNR